jgi:carbon-monoxide dehydrogenase small subunit
MTGSGPLVLRVNGTERSLPDVPPDTRLLDLLRWQLGLRGTKEGCRTGGCGACTVLVDGESVLSCLTPAREMEGREVTTVEGLAGTAEAEAVQRAFAEAGAVQCGYCTPGFVMAVVGLRRERRDGPADLSALASELGGNLCRCTGYYSIVRALARLLDVPIASDLPKSTFTVDPGRSP